MGDLYFPERAVLREGGVVGEEGVVTIRDALRSLINLTRDLAQQTSHSRSTGRGASAWTSWPMTLDKVVTFSRTIFGAPYCGIPEGDLPGSNFATALSAAFPIQAVRRSQPEHLSPSDQSVQRDSRGNEYQICQCDPLGVRHARIESIRRIGSRVFSGDGSRT